MVTQNLTKELICIVQDTLIVTKQYKKFFQVMMAKLRKEACGRTPPPAVPSSPPPGKRSSSNQACCSPEGGPRAFEWSCWGQM